MGAVICALGGIAGATFALPFRKIKTKSYESYWFIYALVGLVCFPLMLASVTCPHLFDVLANTETKTVWQCVGFGALWGLGGLTWGLMIRYLGIGLGLAIGCGLCSATGTLIPPIVTGRAGELVAGKAAVITLVSVIVSLVGIVLVGLAGKFKEGELDEEAKKKAVAEFNFKNGMVVAVFSGIASAGMNFGLQSGSSMEALAGEYGTSDIWVGMPVLVVVLWGGFIVNAAWCFWQNAKNHTFHEYLNRGKADNYNLVFGWAALAGIIWAMQFACQKIGEPMMGDMRYISFAVVMGSCVLFSSLLGVFLGEWKGTGAKTRGALVAGLVVLAASIAIAVVAKQI